jgi:lipid-A-disaccharide synthase-like uncharacterized protein
MLAHVLAWFTVDHVWAIVGFAGQALFASRFIVQWLQSEREGRSVIPVAFWYCSLFGGIVMLAYTVHLQSVSLSLGQASGLIVYARNLYLISKEKSLLRAAAEQPASGAV